MTQHDTSEARAARRPFLPMVGHTAGKRSAVTCHLKCADACFHPVPNTSDNEYFRDIVGVAISRRGLLAGAAAGSALVIGYATVGDAPRAMAAGGGKLAFEPIAPVPAVVDQFVVPDGYQWSPIIRWGDPLFSTADEFDPPARRRRCRSASSGTTTTTSTSSSRRRAVPAILVANQEYTNENIMFPPAATPEELNEQRRVAMAAHGMAVVELTRSGKREPWTYVRRRTAEPPHHGVHAVHLQRAGRRLRSAARRSTTRPARSRWARSATAPAERRRGARCCRARRTSTGTSAPPGTSAADLRYGLADTATSRGWEQIDPRFDARNAGYENEPNRFGWIVEVDPLRPARARPSSTPRSAASSTRAPTSSSARPATPSRTWATTSASTTCTSSSRRTPIRNGASATARATQQDAADRRQPVRRAVHRRLPARGDHRDRARCPSDGAFDGTGEWVPLVVDGVSQVPGFTTERGARQHAPGRGRRRRHEDGPLRGRRAAPHDRARLRRVHQQHRPRRRPARRARPSQPARRQPRRPRHRDHRGRQRRGGDDLRLEHPAGLRRPRNEHARPTSRASPPTRCRPSRARTTSRSTPTGNLWISTDGAPEHDRVLRRSLQGAARGRRARPRAAVPLGAARGRDVRTGGPRPATACVFVAVQHPGENGTWAAAALVLPRLRRARHARRRQVGRTAAQRHPDDEDLTGSRRSMQWSRARG